MGKHIPLHDKNILLIFYVNNVSVKHRICYRNEWRTLPLALFFLLMKNRLKNEQNLYLLYQILYCLDEENALTLLSVNLFIGNEKLISDTICRFDNVFVFFSREILL